MPFIQFTSEDASGKRLKQFLELSRETKYFFSRQNFLELGPDLTS